MRSQGIPCYLPEGLIFTPNLWIQIPCISIAINILIFFFLQNYCYCKNEVAVFSWQGLWRMEKCIISTLKLWNWNCCSCRRKDKFCLPSTVSTEFHRNDLNFIAEGLETRSTYSTRIFAASLKKKEKLEPVGSTVRLRGDKAVYWFSIGQQWLVLAVHWVTMRQLLMLLSQ